MNRVNEIIFPLNGKAEYSSSGIIKVMDSLNRRYAVAEITYERMDDQSFQYIFTPYWDSIAALPQTLFHGIPGIDLSLHREKYYRVNMTPTFVEMRSPGPGREDLWELMEEEGLDYYDRFEWMLRTSKRCGDDNLVVERKRCDGEEYHEIRQETLDHLQCVDYVILDDLSEVAGKEQSVAPELMQLFCSGADILISKERKKVEEQEKRCMMYLLRCQMMAEAQRTKRKRKEGIVKAKAEGKYRGRKKIIPDPILSKEVFEAFEEKRITEKEAMEKLGLASRSTFYRRLKETSGKN